MARSLQGLLYAASVATAGAMSISHDIGPLARPGIHLRSLDTVSSSLTGSVGQEVASARGIDERQLLPVWPPYSSSDDISFVSQNEVLFTIPVTDDDPKLTIQVLCEDCQVTGRVDTDVKFSTLIPSLATADLTLTLFGVSAYLDLGILAQLGGHGERTIWGTKSGGDLEIVLGAELFLDLVIDIDAELEVSGGFQFTIDDGSFVRTNLQHFIFDSNFNGAFETLEWGIESGHANVKMALRLRAEVGLGIEHSDIGGAKAIAGVYANLIEVSASLQSTETCVAELTSHWDFVVGSYIEAGVIIDGDMDIGFDPKVSTTLYQGPTAANCFFEISPSAIESPPVEPSIIVTGPPPLVPSSSTPTGIVTGPPPLTPSSSTPTITVTGPPPLTPSSSTPTHTIIVTGPSPLVNSSSIVSIPTLTSVFVTSSSPSQGGTITPAPSMHTSTVYATTVYTATQCAVHAVNCPKRYQQEVIVTRLVEVYTTLCPVDEVQTLPLPTTSVSVTHHTMTNPTYMTVCPTPIVNSFVPPTNPVEVGPKTATITIVEPQETTSASTVDHDGSASSATDSASGQAASSSIVPPEFTASAPRLDMSLVTRMMIQILGLVILARVL